MKCTYQVLARPQIYTGLSTNRAVHLSEQGSGNLNVANASEVYGGSKASNIADNSSTNRQKQTLAIEAMVNELLAEPNDGFDGFGWFAGRYGKQKRVNAVRLQLGLKWLGHQGFYQFVGDQRKR